jgi:hypothetical protein
VTEAPGSRGSGDPVMILAMNGARELVRQAIKARGLDRKEWPASRIIQAAKALLDSQAGDTIIAAARKQIDT